MVRNKIISLNFESTRIPASLARVMARISPNFLLDHCDYPRLAVQPWGENKLRSFAEFRTTFRHLLRYSFAFYVAILEFHYTYLVCVHRAMNVSKCQWLTAETIIARKSRRWISLAQLRDARSKGVVCLSKWNHRIVKPFSCTNLHGWFWERHRPLTFRSFEGKKEKGSWKEEGLCISLLENEAAARETAETKQGGRDKRVLTERRHLLYPSTSLPLRHPVILYSYKNPR